MQGGYILLIPKRHVACIGAMEEREIIALCAVKQRIYSAMGYINEGSALTIFEHGIAGQSVFHAHLHIIPVRAEFTDGVRKDFIWKELVTLPVMQSSWIKIAEEYKKRNKPYLLWKDAGLGLKVLWDPRNVPLQYFRILLFRSIKQPELANWRTVDPNEDRKRRRETIKTLKPYFNTK